MFSDLWRRDGAMLCCPYWRLHQQVGVLSRPPEPWTARLCCSSGCCWGHCEGQMAYAGGGEEEEEEEHEEEEEEEEVGT